MTTGEAQVPDGVEGVLAFAAHLQREGRVLDAIQILMDANRLDSHAGFEEQLVRLRHEPFDTANSPPPMPRPRIVAKPALSEQLPELTPSELTPESLREGFARHGCVLVRELIPKDRAEELTHGIDQALAAWDAAAQGAPATETSPWYAKFTPRPGKYRIAPRGPWLRECGSMWTVDSPRMLFDVLDLFDSIGIRDLLGRYFGERPALSANKFNLRRLPTTTKTNWHQDGAFLGGDVDSVDVWLGLSQCGVDAPGLDIVPRRFDELVETGTDGAIFKWSISPDVVEQLNVPVIRPEFGPGDALLFDQLFLHRTGIDPSMTRERYAIESWFFAPSSYPDGQVPIIY